MRNSISWHLNTTIKIKTYPGMVRIIGNRTRIKVPCKSTYIMAIYTYFFV